MSEPSGEEAKGAKRAIDFDTWARVSARLMKKSAAERAEILGEEKLEESDFQAANQRFSAQLDEDIAEGRGSRPKRYAAACTEEKQRRKQALEDAERAQRVALEGPAAEATVEPPHRFEVPSFLVASGMKPADERPSTQELISIPPQMPPAFAPAGTVDLSAFADQLETSPTTLPFARGQAPVHSAEPRSERLSPAPGAGATLDVSEVLAAENVPMPFHGDRASSPPPSATETHGHLNVGQYASLCAELASAPGNLPAVLLRYGFRNPEAHAQAKREWEARLEQSSELRVKWAEGFQAYSDWLAKNR